MQAMIEDEIKEESCDKNESVEAETPTEQTSKVYSNQGYMVKWVQMIFIIVGVYRILYNYLINYEFILKFIFIIITSLSVPVKVEEMHISDTLRRGYIIRWIFIFFIFYCFREKIDDSLLTSGWETVKGELMSLPEVKDIHIDSSQLPLTTNSDGNKVGVITSGVHID